MFMYILISLKHALQILMRAPGARRPSIGLWTTW